LEKILIEEANGVGDRGKLLWPLRASLSGKKASASPFEIAEILGKQKTLARITEAKQK
jgi:glutamyl/glutaminyl-tRNA synthetase